MFLACFKKTKPRFKKVNFMISFSDVQKENECYDPGGSLLTSTNKTNVPVRKRAASFKTSRPNLRPERKKVRGLSGHRVTHPIAQY